MSEQVPRKAMAVTVTRRKRRSKRFWVALLVFTTAAAAFLYTTGVGYRLRDRAHMALRHVNRVIHAQFRWPLPGTPDLARLDERLKQNGLKRGDPVYVRIFKSEMELELWIKRNESYVLFATYPICYWSGQLGPKQRTGDHQAPEGFYTVTRDQLNPNSHWHRAFNLGFPNLLDRAHGRTGSFLMVHGGCSSIGCYAMTNPVIGEVWELVTAAIDNGQERFAVHAFPFRMTEARMASYGEHHWTAFWRDMKPAFDLFEANHVPPRVSMCGKRYAVTPGDASAKSALPLQASCPIGEGA
jgi:murein L,D-transpeptidase YafK